jgi:hypothetical protein
MGGRERERASWRLEPYNYPYASFLDGAII